MTRDRLADLQRVRGRDSQLVIGDKLSTARFDSSFRRTCKRTLISMGVDQVDGDPSTGPLSQIEDVKRCIQEIGDEVERVKKLQSDIISSPVQDERLQQELDQLMSTIKRSSNGVRSKLKEIESAVKKEEQEATPDSETGVVYVKADIRMRRIQHAALSRQFVDTMTIYQTAQADYRDRCKDRIKRHLEIVGSELSDDEVEKIMEEGNWSVFTQGIIQETAEARQTLADVQARCNDMIKLEQSIRELHEMFMEMALLVETQGELIDRIDFNVTNAQEYVDSGTKALKKGLRSKQDARKRKMWIIIIAIVIILIIGLIIYLSAK